MVGDPSPFDPEPNRVVLGDNLDVLHALETERFQMIYIDPPFNTGQIQKRTAMSVIRDETGTRGGFQGKRYSVEVLSAHQYPDIHDDFLGMLQKRLVQAHRVLKSTGTLYLHLDYREVHYAKVMLDSIFGRENFLNEVIWAYDYGGKANNKWPAKHDNILVYVKDFRKYHFDNTEVDREPYMAPGLVTPEKAAKGKLPTDTWWHTIVPTNGREKTGYPNQKPEGILRRMIAASTRPNDEVLDFFAGSGTTGAVCQQMGRRFYLVDNNPTAIDIMERRLGPGDIEYIRDEGVKALDLIDADDRAGRTSDSGAATVDGPLVGGENGGEGDGVAAAGATGGI